jgi:hypothetical protein
MSVQGTTKRTLSITVDTSMISGIPRHEFSVPAPEQWIRSILGEMGRTSFQETQPPQPTYIKEAVRETG